MTEAEFIERWSSERPMYEAWGDFVTAKIIDGLNARMPPTPVEVFIRLPVKPRLKEDRSLLDKAFYRGKCYINPYEEITDKVGIRFVVLLATEISIVERVIVDADFWRASKDRDYEDEQLRNPIQFDYAALHYIVRAQSELLWNGIVIASGTPCEVQVKNILQHAYSELAHDTIYKPRVEATPEMKRCAAKSMALIEATNDYFQQVVDRVRELKSVYENITTALADLYSRAVLCKPEPSRLEGLLLEAYQPKAELGAVSRVEKMLAGRPFIVSFIQDRSKRILLYRQPSILLVYLFALERPSDTKATWPLTPEELQPIYVDLGMSFDSY